MEDDIIALGETSGLVVAFYELLWRKKNEKQEKQCKYPGFFVHLPDTIVYNFSQPQYWYFTSLNYRCVNKKKRHNMNSKNILEKFLRCRSRSGIVAGYMWNDDSPEGRARVRDGGSPVCIRYLDAEGLKSSLLRLGQFHGNGVLQQFIDPKTAVDGALHNNIIQASWQPNHVSFERRQNKHSLTDPRLSFQKRAETFEGTFENSESVPLVSPILLDEMTNICNGIAEHLWFVADCIVKSLVLNFKIDENNKVWLLFCSQISVIERDTVARPLGELMQPTNARKPEGNPRRSRKEEEAERATADAEARQVFTFGLNDSCAETQLHAMLERLPAMKVDASFHPLPRPAGSKSKHSDSHGSSNPSAKDRKPAREQPPEPGFCDMSWGQSAEAMKRIVFEKQFELSASQR